MADRMRERVAMIGSSLMVDACGALLAAEADVAIVAHGSLVDALTVVRDGTPAIVVVELGRGDGARIAILSEIRKLPGPPRIIVLANRVSREEVAGALQAGVDACIDVEGGKNQLLQALDAVRQKQRYIGPLISEILLQEPSSESGVAPLKVSARERQVLALVAEGKTEADIGTILELSRKTIHAHRTSLMRKLGAHNSAMLVRLAIERGLLL
jgi:DNA-binding NarL/FixJ family response regulator